MEWKEVSLVVGAVFTGICALVAGIGGFLALFGKSRRQDVRSLTAQYERVIQLVQNEARSCQEALEATRRRISVLEDRILSVDEAAHQVAAQVLATQDGIITLVNASACLLFGYIRPENMIGQNIEMLIPERLRSHHREALSQIRKVGFLDTYSRVLDTVCLCKNGSERPVSIHIQVEKKDGNALFLATIHQREVPLV